MSRSLPSGIKNIVGCPNNCVSFFVARTLIEWFIYFEEILKIFGDTLKDLKRFEEIWKDLERFGEI